MITLHPSKENNVNTLSFPEAPADSCTAERKVYFCPGQISNFSFLLRLLSLPPFFPLLIHIFLILFHTFRLKI